MFAGAPVHLAVAAFALAAHHMQLGVMLAHIVKVLTAFPLEAEALHAALQPVYDALHVVLPVGVECARIELHLGMLRFESRRQVFLVEPDGSFRCPSAAGIWRVAVGFVLVHHHIDWDVFLSVEFDETAEHIGIRLQIARVLNEIVLRSQFFWKDVLSCVRGLHLLPGVAVEEQVVLLFRLRVVWRTDHAVVLIDFHPRRRAPRRHPEGHIGLPTLRHPDELDDILLIVFDVEMLEREVAGHGVARVPRAAVVVGVHRQAATSETQVAIGREDVVHNFLLLLRLEHPDGIKVEFIETGSPGAELSSRV